MPNIIVVGSLNADLVVRTPRFPQPGETISGEDLQIIPGGKGANQAVAAARQGASVAMVGRVGKDSFGPELINNLKQNHVDASHVQIDAGSATGTAIIVVDPTGQNSIVLSPGGNGRVTATDVNNVSFSDHQAASAPTGDSCRERFRCGATRKREWLARAAESCTRASIA